MTKRYPFQKSRRWWLVRFLDFFLDRFQTSNSSKSFPKTIGRILIVRLDQIGDLICTTPVLPALKQRYPNAKITLLTSTEGEAVFNENPFVDKLIIFRSNWFRRSVIPEGFSRGSMDSSPSPSARKAGGRFKHSGMTILEFFKIVSQLRKFRFDLGFDLRGDIRNIVMMTLGGVRYRVGYGIAGGAGLLHRLGEYDEGLHQVALNMKLVSGETGPQRNFKPKIYLNASEQDEANRILAESGVQSGDQVFAVHPEAGYRSKEWEEQNLTELIKRLIQNKQNKIVIFGLSDAKNIARHFAQSNQVIDLVGKLSLRQMIAVMSRCQVFIGNDSGPSHIAQALGVPALVFASGTNEYDKWGIWLRPSIILSHPVSCAPCYLQECNVEGHPCMSQISAERAHQALGQLVAV